MVTRLGAEAPERRENGAEQRAASCDQRLLSVLPASPVLPAPPTLPILPPMHDAPDETRSLRRLAWAASALAVALIALGGIVRITGSGMGCGEHWPRCNGEWFPPLDLPTAIEISHRWVAVLLSVLIVAVAGTAWRRHRRARWLTTPATAALGLLIVQVLLGAVTVKLALPAGIVIAHLANAMLLLAALVVTALRARAGGLPPRPEHRHGDHRLVQAIALGGFGVILLGAHVANLHAGWVCRGFPLCSGSGLLPPRVPLGTLHWLHRIAAFAFVAAVAALSIRLSRRLDDDAAPLRLWANALLGLTVLQIVVAAAMVLGGLPATLRAAHLVVGALIWGTLVIATVRSSRLAAASQSAMPAQPATPAQPASPASPASPGIMRDLITLTKPRIISLLLVTTVAPMFITDRGVPPFSLVLWVIVGGYLMAGGANAINMWFDRDIDTRMTRTRLRPIPSGRITPSAGLLFGLALGGTAFAMFYWMVNPLAAWLALGGLAFYVLVYTMLLKRTTTQNIVIGGAAGAFPPLVGWAAVTGSLDLAAIYLFAIIFYWTPPHFWALALIKQGEYSRAGIPMLPVVRGERRTKMEMLIYTLLLVPLTIMPSLFGALGPFYLVAAILLGARLLWYCIQLLREDGVTPTAWKMYRFSLLYLALLFVAMGVDRALPFDRPLRADNILPLMPAVAPDSSGAVHTTH